MSIKAAVVMICLGAATAQMVPVSARKPKDESKVKFDTDDGRHFECTVQVDNEGTEVVLYFGPDEIFGMGKSCKDAVKDWTNNGPLDSRGFGPDRNEFEPKWN
jgi:hypothetical protein